MIVIALGSNLPSHVGTPRQSINAALQALANNAAVPVKVSRYYQSLAWPDPNDPKFVNAVAQVETRHSPQQLMQILHDIEITFGRKRGILNAPRTLDLDLIDYGGRVERGPPVLPHPRVYNRAFVLLPLADVAPDWIHPATGLALHRLIARLPRKDRDATVALDW